MGWLRREESPCCAKSKVALIVLHQNVHLEVDYNFVKKIALSQLRVHPTEIECVRKRSARSFTEVVTGHRIAFEINVVILEKYLRNIKY